MVLFNNAKYLKICVVLFKWNGLVDCYPSLYSRRNIQSMYWKVLRISPTNYQCPSPHSYSWKISSAGLFRIFFPNISVTVATRDVEFGEESWYLSSIFSSFMIVHIDLVLKLNLWWGCSVSTLIFKIQFLEAISYNCDLKNPGFLCIQLVGMNNWKSFKLWEIKKFNYWFYFCYR